VGSAAFAVGLAATTPAQAETTFDTQVWTAAFFTARLTGREPEATSGVSAWLDLHARRSGAGVVGIVRPALGYRFSKAISVWAGYGAIGGFDDLPDRNTQEHRGWQQALLTLPAGALIVQLRPRLEERARAGADEVAFRARLLARANVAFGTAVPVILATLEEAFFHLNDVEWGPRGGFDQSRLFLGIGLKGPAGSRVEVGYLNVTVLRPTDLLITHNVSMNLFADF